jgi:hypothetical protein
MAEERQPTRKGAVVGCGWVYPPIDSYAYCTSARAAAMSRT